MTISVSAHRIVRSGPGLLCRPLADSEQAIPYLLDLLVRCPPDWALETALQVQGKQTSLLFRTQDLCPLDESPAQYLTPAHGLLITQSLARSLLAADDCLIEKNQLVLSPEYVYCDWLQAKAHLLVLPVQAVPSVQTIQAVQADPSEDAKSDAFTALLHSIGKAFHWPDQLMDRLSQAAAPDGSCAASRWTALIDRVSKEIETASKPDRESLNHNIADEKQRPPKERPAALFILLVALHLLCVVLVGLKFSRIVPATLNLPNTFIISFAFLLILLDFWSSGLWRAVGRHLLAVGKRLSAQLLAAFQRRAQAASNRPGHPTPPKTLHTRRASAKQTGAGSLSGQTVHLEPETARHRLGLLSEKLPGSPEELDGIRAFILLDEFIIGRDATQCDLSLPAPSIGRSHARITRRAGSFFVTDLGSKNGTSLDGRRLNKHEDYLLPDRCRLGFADQNFFFTAD